jgi:hypothetical protein
MIVQAHERKPGPHGHPAENRNAELCTSGSVSGQYAGTPDTRALTLWSGTMMLGATKPQPSPS